MNKLYLLFIVFILGITGINAKEKVFKELVRVAASPVKDQQQNGTCWDYATTSFIESELLRMGKGEYDLSEMFFVRYAYLLKAQKYLFFQGHNNFSQGGQSHDVMNVLREFGAVPETVYPAVCENHPTQNHSHLLLKLTDYLSSINDSFDEKAATQWPGKVEKILNDEMGRCPASFTYSSESYSSKTFAESLNINPDDYCEFMSFSHRPFYKQSELEVPDNWSHDLYWNIPVDMMVTVIDSALFKGYSVCWDGDTSEDGFDFSQGIATLPSGTRVSQEKRQKEFENRETTDDHQLHIIGISEDKNGKKFYLVKNSWGTQNSRFDGCMYLSEEYIRMKTIAIMVHKSALPESLKQQIHFNQ